MKKKILFAAWLTALLIVVWSTDLFSQNQKIVYPTPASYQNSTGQTLRPTADGGYILTGYADDSDNFSFYRSPRVIKINAGLQTAWDNTYLDDQAPAAAIRYVSEGFELNNGNYAVSFRDDSSAVDMLLIAPNGDLINTLELPQLSADVLLLDLLPDGNLLATRNYFQSGWKAGVVHLDANGAVVYSKEITSLPTNYEVIRLSNGDLLFRTYSFQTQKYTLTRTDFQGNILWTSTPAAGLNGLMVALPGGGYGISQGSTPNFVVRQYDAQGVFVATTPPAPAEISPSQLAAYPDGSLLISGSTVTNRGVMARFQLNGTVDWTAVSPDDNQPTQFSLLGKPTADGWAIGVSDGYGGGGPNASTHFGVLRVQANTGIFINSISGRVAKDNNENCLAEGNEPGVGQTRVTAHNAQGEAWGSFCAADGSYQILVPGGDYTLTTQSVYPFFFLCPDAPVSASFPPDVNGSVSIDLPIQSQELIHHISGQLTLDENDNCTADAGEPPLAGWHGRLVLSSGQYINFTADNNGQYSFFVPDGDYSVRIDLFNQSYSFCGPDVANISFNSPDPQSVTADFIAFAEVDCAVMKTSLYTTNVRPCTTAAVFVNYRNNGTITAENATLTVSLDPSLSYLNANLVPAAVNGNQILFNLGDVPPTAWGWSGNQIKINVETDCDLPVGNQVCISSQVTPNTACLPDWDGAIVAVEGECVGDSAFFTIRNIGNAPNSQALDFVIVEDQIVLKQGTFQLPAGGVEVHGVLPMGTDTAVTIIADQEPGFPGDPTVTFSLTGCVSGGSEPSGYGGNPGPFSAQICVTVTGSYDPNDKQAFPLGSGPDHVVQPGTPLQYTIRFQNTGTDTAFLVVIRDTLSAFLDPGSLQVESSTHPYEVFLLGDLLQFRFANILLPDSTTNPDASCGQITFTLHPRANLPLGTVVENRAAIYFDFNEPIITNTVRRKYDQLFFVSTDEAAGEYRLPVRIFPNPFADQATLELPADAPAGAYRFELFDMGGRTLKSLTFSDTCTVISREDLPDGILGWRLTLDGRLMASGQVVAVK